MESLILTGCVAIFLPIQLLLCFKVKRLVIRLLPVLILSSLMVFFITRCFFASDWEGLGYAFLAVFAGFMLLMCGTGWMIWAVIHFLKRRCSKKQ